MAAKKKPAAPKSSKKPDKKPAAKPEVKKEEVEKKGKKVDKKAAPAEEKEEEAAAAAPETAAVANPVEEELRKACKLKGQGKGKDIAEDESEEDYRGRIVESANELTDEEYNALSEDAQAWFEKAAEAFNKKKTIPEFPQPTAEKPAAAGKKDKKVADKKDKDKGGEAEAAAAPEKKDTTKKKDKDEAPKKRSGGSGMASDIYASDPGASFEDFKKENAKAGNTIADSQLQKMFKEGQKWYERFRAAGKMK